MTRIKHAVSTRRRKKRVLKQTKGQFGQRKSRYLHADRALKKALTYAYRDRKVKKREFRSLWLIRINAACREAGIMYSRFISGLNKAKVAINRKLLAEMAVNSPDTFRQLVKIAQEANVLAPAAKS